MIVVTDRFRTIHRVLEALRRQTAREQLEVVIVIPAGSRDEDDPPLDGFAGVRIVEIPSIHPVPAARAAGIRSAAAPIVFLGETHSFPHPGFAQALIEAHDGTRDIVVPGLANANPATPWSWASFLIDYGTWYASLPAGEVGGGPTWNVAYSRSLLLEADSRLELAMEHGDEMAKWLGARTVRTFFEPKALLDHANISTAGPWAEQRFLAGVLVANARRKRWAFSRRILYVVASPLIPLVIVYRLRRALGNLIPAGTLPAGTLPAVIIGAIIRTAGEVVGYVAGAKPDAQERMDHYEIHKMSFTEQPA